jgi:Tfp pilus assembly protein PilO/cell division septation protein DedD
LGSVDLGEQKKFLIIQVVICIALFLIAGYLSYRYMISPEIEKLQSKLVKYHQEKGLLKSMEEEINNLNMLANNVQMLKTELISIRNQVFNSDAEMVNFMRILPITAAQSNNNLTSIVPIEMKDASDISSLSPPPEDLVDQANNMSKNKAKAKNKEKNKTKNKYANESAQPPPPRTLPCSLKPIEISFVGDYDAVIKFFDELRKTDQYMTVTSLNMVSDTEQSSNIRVRTVLNLLKMGIEVNTAPPILVAKQPNLATNQNQTVALTQQTATVPQPNKTISNYIHSTINQSVKIVNSAQNIAPELPIKQTQIAVPKPIVNIGMSTKPVIAKPAINAKQPQSVAMAKPKPTNIDNTNKSTTMSAKNSDKAAINQAQKSVINDVKQVINATKPSSSIQAEPVIGKNMHYIVRVGVFIFYENAEHLVKLLKSHEYKPWIKTYTYNGRATYWVYAGAFETKERAENFAETMNKKLSGIDDYVITEMYSTNNKDS